MLCFFFEKKRRVENVDIHYYNYIILNLRYSKWIQDIKKSCISLNNKNAFQQRFIYSNKRDEQ